MPPRNPIELVLILLWQHRAGRLLTGSLGILGIIALAAQGIEPLIKLKACFVSQNLAKIDLPEYVEDGYYVETRRTVFDLGTWREITPAQEDEKVSLAVCYKSFTIYRQKQEAKNFIHRFSSTAKVAPDVFSDRAFITSLVQGHTELGKTRLWEIKADISNEPLHKPINLQFVIFFWNSFNRKDQWDVGMRIFNSRTDHAEISIRFPQWKPVTSVNFETRTPIGDRSQTQPFTPDPARVHYDKDQQGKILAVTWSLEQPSENKTYWMTWDWTPKSY